MDNEQEFEHKPEDKKWLNIMAQIGALDSFTSLANNNQTIVITEGKTD